MSVWSPRDGGSCGNIPSYPEKSWLVRAGFVLRSRTCNYRHVFACGLMYVWRLPAKRACVLLDTVDSWPAGHSVRTAEYAFTTAVASSSKKAFTSEEYSRLRSTVGHIVTIFDGNKPTAGFHCVQVVCYLISSDIPLVVVRKLPIIKKEHGYVTVRNADPSVPPLVLVWSSNIQMHHCGYCVHEVGTMALHCGDSLPVHLIEHAHISSMLKYHSTQTTPR